MFIFNSRGIIVIIGLIDSIKYGTELQRESNLRELHFLFHFVLLVTFDIRYEWCFNKVIK